MSVAGKRASYRGPGAADWIVAFASTILIALEIQTQEALGLLQSGTSYYFDSPWVPQIHRLAIGLDGLVFFFAALWLASPWKRLAERAMTVVAVLGLLLCWVEIVYATKLATGAVFILPQLPFRPVNNVGMVGAQVFGTYLLFKAPVVRLAGWRALLVKLVLAVAFWFFQSILWQIVGPK